MVIHLRTWFILANLLVSFLCALGASAVENQSVLSCLPRFRTDPNHFKNCKTNICFVLKSEVPVLHLDPRMEAENNQTLFRCKDRRTLFPELGGIIFDIKDSIPELDNAFCVYSGNNCGSDGVLHFVEQHSGPRENYRFATSAMLFLTPKRITPFTKPTVPILKGDMVIVGPQLEPPKRKNVFKTMLLPFDRNVSFFAVAVFIGFLLLWIAGILCSIKELSWRSVLQHSVGESEWEPLNRSDVEMQANEKEMADCQDDIRQSIKLWTKTLSSAFKWLLAILIIFYELVAFDWIFAKRSMTATIDLQTLSKSNLKEYIVPGEGALELEFRRSIDPKGRLDNRSVPYNRCGDFSDCYEKVENKTHPAKFQVTFDLNARYYLQKNGACDHLAIYKTKRPLFSFSGVWYLSPNIPEDLRRRIDASILALQSEGKVRRMMSNAVDDFIPADCGKSIVRIDVQLLWPLISAVIGPMVIIVVVSLLCICYARAKFNRLLEGKWE